MAIQNPHNLTQESEYLSFIREYFDGTSDASIIYILSQANKFVNSLREIHHMDDVEHDKIAQLNQFARLFASNPYTATALLEVPGDSSKLVISCANQQNTLCKSDVQRAIELIRNYSDAIRRDQELEGKCNFYEGLYLYNHPYVNLALVKYKEQIALVDGKDSRLEKLNSLIQAKSDRREQAYKDNAPLFNEFVTKYCVSENDIFPPQQVCEMMEWSKGKALTLLRDQTNFPHVEMRAIHELQVDYVKLIEQQKKPTIYIGLAPLSDHKTPSTCAGCTAEILSLRHTGVKVITEASSPNNLPQEKKYRFSDNILSYASKKSKTLSKDQIVAQDLLRVTKNDRARHMIFDTKLVLYLDERAQEILRESKCNAEQRTTLESFVKDYQALSALELKSVTRSTESVLPSVSQDHIDLNVVGGKTSASFSEGLKDKAASSTTQSLELRDVKSKQEFLIHTLETGAQQKVRDLASVFTQNASLENALPSTKSMMRLNSLTKQVKTK